MLDHGRNIRKNRFVVGDPHPQRVGETDLAVHVNVFQLGEVAFYVVFVEAAVHYVYASSVGAVPDLAVLHVAVAEREQPEPAGLGHAAVLEVTPSRLRPGLPRLCRALLRPEGLRLP